MKRLILSLVFLPAIAFAAEPAKTPRPRPTPRPFLAGTSPQDAVAHNVLDQGPKRYGKHLTLASDSGHWPKLFATYKYFADSVLATADECTAAGSIEERRAAAKALLGAKQTNVTLDPKDYFPSGETKASSEISGLREQKEEADWETKATWLTVSSVGLSSSGSIAVACGAAWVGPSSELADCYVLTKSDEGWKPACRAALYRH